ADTSRGDVQIIVDTVTQNFEVVTPADSGPVLPAFAPTWIDSDEDADPEAEEQERAGEVVARSAPPPAPAPRAPEPAVNDNGTKVPRNGSLVTDREEPVWLYADEDYGASFSAPPAYEYDEDTGYLVTPPEDERNHAERPRIDASGRLAPPPAPAARAWDGPASGETFAPHERRPRRTPPRREEPSNGP